MRSLLILSALLFAAAALSAPTDGRNLHKPGGYQPIIDLNDPRVKDIASFAVEEYNKKTGNVLKLIRVVRGKYQVVAGVNYILIIEASDAGGRTGKYKAFVFEGLQANDLHLISFHKVRG